MKNIKIKKCILKKIHILRNVNLPKGNEEEQKGAKNEFSGFIIVKNSLKKNEKQ
jgi:hypothetical protein